MEKTPFKSETMTKTELVAIKPKYYIFPGLTDRNVEFIEARYKFNSLIDVVCGHYKVLPVNVLKYKKKRLYVRPRQVLMYLLFTEKGMYCTWIGEFMHRDHTTVLYAIQKVKDLIRTGDRVGQDIIEIKKVLDKM